MNSNTNTEYFFCDHCGRLWKDSDENLLNSCTCGQYIQSMDYATNDQVEEARERGEL